MKFKIVSRDKSVTESLYEHVMERSEATFGRFIQWVREARVTLSDQNGPRGGGDDKVVAIQLAVRAGDPLRFEARSDSYERSLERALTGAKRAILSSRHLGSRRPDVSVAKIRRPPVAPILRRRAR